MSDLLGSSSYVGISNDIGYSFRFNVDQGLMQSESLSYNNESFLGNFGTSYSRDRKEVNTILDPTTYTDVFNDLYLKKYI